MKSTAGLAVAVALVMLGPSCSREPAEPAYAPGLGEIMTLQQMRHIKLWLAGSAGNWPLASYELDELNEGFDDAARYHPTHKDSPLRIDQLIDKMMKQPLEQLRSAVAARDRERFVQAFDEFTEGCNGCHRAADFGFNVVTRPATNPYPDQVFAPGGLGTSPPTREPQR